MPKIDHPAQHYLDGPSKRNLRAYAVKHGDKLCRLTGGNKVKADVKQTLRLDKEARQFVVTETIEIRVSYPNSHSGVFEQ